MWLPTKAQIDAASRHAITAAGVAVTIFGLQAKGISMENVTVLINSLGSTVNTLVQLVAAAGVFYGAVRAANSASPTNQIASVKAIATDAGSPVSDEAKKTLIAATVSLDEVQGIVADPATAHSIPSPAVMSSDTVKIISNESGLDTNRGQQ